MHMWFNVLKLCVSSNRALLAGHLPFVLVKIGKDSPSILKGCTQVKCLESCCCDLCLLGLHIFVNFGRPCKSMKSRLLLLNHKIKDLTDACLYEEALHVYSTLRVSGIKPNRFTFTSVLKSCVGALALDVALSTHSHLTKCGFGNNLFIMNSLIGMYSNFSSVNSARRVFDDMPHRSLISWNLMISGYGKCGYITEAFKLCNSLRHEGLALDKVGLKIVLPVLGHVKALTLGKSIHAHAITVGLSQETTVATALLDAYSRCGDLHASKQLFDEIVHKDTICWNAMITGCSQLGRPVSVLELFNVMRFNGFKPSIPTIFLLLQACTCLSAHRIGRCMHGYVAKLGFSADVSVSGLLIDMYSKCGELCSAAVVFNEMPKGNVHSWTCMIRGLGMHGYGWGALMAFFKMVKRGISPDGICFLVLLASCSHCGLIKEGRKVFYYMVSQFGIEPSKEHCGSIVDLFGRGGYITEAVEFLSEMRIEPDSCALGALLAGCRIHGHEEMGEVFERLVGSHWLAAGLYKLLVDICASQEHWEGVVKIRRYIEERGLVGSTGCSLIELNR